MAQGLEPSPSTKPALSEADRSGRTVGKSKGSGQAPRRRRRVRAVSRTRVIGV